MDEIFHVPFLCLSLAVGARGLPTRLPGQSPRATQRKRSEGRLRPPSRHGEEEQWRCGSVMVENSLGWRMLVLPPGGVGEPLVCLPLALATGWPAGRPGHLERDGDQGKGSAGGSLGWPRVEDRRSNNATEGETHWEVGLAGLAFLRSITLRSLLLCLLLFPWFPSCHRPVSSCLCGHHTPQIQEVPKARGERALWRVLTRPDLSSQIEAPVGVGPRASALWGICIRWVDCPSSTEKQRIPRGI